TFGHPAELWPLAQSILLVLSSVLFWRLIFRAAAGAAFAFACVALLVSNPIFLKWAELPYSELAAVTWGLAAITFIPPANTQARRARAGGGRSPGCSRAWRF